MAGALLRATVLEGQPWFVGKDAAEALGYKSARDAITAHVPAGHRRSRQIPAPGAVPLQEGQIISEAGLYRLIMRSSLPTAVEFQEWVTDVVLPTIRRTGGYNGGRIPSSYAEALEAAAKLERELVHTRPRAELMQMFQEKRDGLGIGDVGAMFGYKPHQFYEIMRSWGAVTRIEGSGNLVAADIWETNGWLVQRKTGSPAVTYQGIEEIERKLNRKVFAD